MNLQHVFDDLIQINEVSDGEFDYFVRDGRLYCNQYGEGTDVIATYRIGIEIAEVVI